MKTPIYLKVEKKINQPLEEIWKVLALEFGNVSNYNPEIKASKIESIQKNGIGAKRHCDFQKKGYIKEEIIEWINEDSFKLKLIESSVPMEFLESKFSFIEASNETIVIQEFWYRMPSPFGWLSGLMKQKMRSTLENGLNGLSNYLKTN